MALTNQLYISFDPIGTADASRTWVDYSSSLLGFDIKGGRQSELDSFDGVTGTYTLFDTTRELDPTNTASARYPNVVPNRMLWHRVTDGTTLYDVFKGYVDGWGPQLVSAGSGQTAQLRVSEKRKLLNVSHFTAARPDVVEYPDVISADEPSFYYRLGEPAGTKLIHHSRRKRKTWSEHGVTIHYHGVKRWTTRRTRAEIEGESGPAGTYKNNPTLGEPGAIAGDAATSVRFASASSQYAKVGPLDQDDLISRNRVTLEAWVNLSTFGAAYQSIISGPFGTGAGTSVYSIGISATQKVTMTIMDSGAIPTTAAGATTVTTGAWHHVVGTWDGTNLLVYLDGSLDGTTSSARTLASGNATESLTFAGFVSTGGGAPILYLNGWLQDIAIYEKALSASRISAHYNASLLGFAGARTGERVLQVLKLHAPTEFENGTFSGNEITDTIRDTGTSGDGRPFQPLDFKGGFETGDDTEWTTKEEAVAGRLTFVTSPLREGTKAARFEVQTGDTVSGGERLEVKKNNQRAKDGDEYFYGFSTYIPTGWVDTITGTQFKILAQWKDSADLGPPLFALRAKNGDFTLQRNTGVSDAVGVGTSVAETTLLTSFPKDVWNDFIFQFRWRTASTGIVKVWHKRETESIYTLLLTASAIPTLLSTGAGVANSDAYSKQGLYRNISPRTETDVLYHDAYRIGRSYFDVAYGQQDPEGSTGIWQGTTQLCINYDAVTDATTGVAADASTVTREVTTDTAFGGTRFKVDTNGAATGEGIRIRSKTGQQGSDNVAAGDTFTASAFVKRTAGVRTFVAVSMRINYTDATNTTGTATTYDLTDYWMPVYALPHTANGAKTIDSIQIRILTTVSIQNVNFYVSGVMIEEGTINTPVVAATGASATRSAARVQIPTTNLDETQGWMAMLVREGADYTATGDRYYWVWSDDATHRFRLYWDDANNQYLFGRANVSESLKGWPHVHPRGAFALIIVSWDAAQLHISVDGGAFVSTNNTTIPTLAATLMDIGSNAGANHISGDVKWAAWGRGTLTDADAALIYNEGPWTSALSDKKGLTVWDGWRTSVSTWNLDRGQYTMPPARYAGLPPIELINDAVGAEGEPAMFVYSRAGNPTFRDSTHRARAPWSASRVAFGNGTNQVQFEDAAISDQDAFLYNEIRGTREDGTETFSAVDSASQTAYGHYVLPLDVLPLANDADAQAYVNAMLARFKDPMVRITSFRLNAADTTGATWLLNLNIGDQVSVNIPDARTGGTILTQSSYVELRGLSQSDRGAPFVGEFSVSPR